MREYIPVLMFVIVAIGFAGVTLGLSQIIMPRRFNAKKLAPYECGFEAFEDARAKFDVRYYLMAILFVVFDLEIAFMFPWAVVFRSLGLVGLIEMGLFILILFVGYVYLLGKRALEWES